MDITSRASAATLSNDLKIFFGKSAQIEALRVSGKIVFQKWYMAYDTGEFFIGGQVGTKLYKFGGSNTSYSDTDIKNLIKSYTANDLTVIKSQLVEIKKYYNDTANSVSNLTKLVNDTVDLLNTNTRTYVTSKVDEVISELDELTYSKTEVDKLISAAKDSVNTQHYYKSEIDTKLSKYLKSTDAVVQYMTGDQLYAFQINKTGTLVGVCIKDSTLTDGYDPLFQKGHTYRIVMDEMEDITPEGTGSGGSSYATPVITLEETSYTGPLMVGSDYSGTKTFDYTITNLNNISSNLILNENGASNIATVTPQQSGSISAVTSLLSLGVGKYTYKLSATDKHSNSVIGEFDIYVYAPIYYGVAKSGSLSEADIQSMTYEIVGESAGTYHFSVTTSNYLWFAVPDNVSFNSEKVYCSGFKVPFYKTEESIVLTHNGITTAYSLYRSVESIQSGSSFDIDVE